MPRPSNPSAPHVTGERGEVIARSGATWQSLPMDAVEDIKSRLDVVDTVAEYLQLKTAGSGSFKACCPFHQEKTPSFFVNRPRQSWHCFGCDQGGDIISFVQKMEGMDFPEALEFLANKAGVTLPTFTEAHTSERKRLIEVNDLASRYFRAQLLQNPRADHARAYVAKRGLDDLTCDVWRVGYAPEGWNNLTDTLRAKGVTDDEMLRVGLAAQGERGSYDRFRNRLMFTICDLHGKVVGFTGRILVSDAKEAKYVNTPETFIYKKSHILFGLDKARGEIKRQDLAVIVEGNMDVITSHQFGVTNVVASSGTALNAEQLNLLKRFTKNFAIAFDADAAGRAATIRGFDLARQMDCNVRVISLPVDVGKDPDEIIRYNLDLWKQAIHSALPIIEWLYRNAFRGQSAFQPEEKKRIAAEIVPEFRRIANAVERDAWVVRLAKDLNVSEDALRQELLTQSVSRPLLSIHKPHPINASVEEGQKSKKNRLQELEERVEAIFLLKPELRVVAEEYLKGYPMRQPAGQEDSYLAMLADREFQDQSIENLQRELVHICSLLRALWIAEQRRQVEEEMRAAECAGDVSRIQLLLSRFQALHETGTDQK